MARPFKTLTDKQVAEVETLAAVLTASQIADYLGIGRRTFYDLMARNPDIAARYKKGRARAIGSIAQSLISKARAGDTTSMIFYLKTQAGWRETVQVETLEVDRTDGPCDVEIDFSGMSDTALLELTAAIDARDARLSRSAPRPVLIHAPSDGRCGPDADEP